MDRKIAFLLALALLLCLAFAGCGRTPEAQSGSEAAPEASAESGPAEEAPAAESPSEPEEAAPADAEEAGELAEDAEASQEDDFTEQVIAVCEKNGIGLSLRGLEQSYAVYSQTETPSTRTVCDTINGERDSSFQIIIDDYEDPDAAATEFALMKEQQEDYAQQTGGITRILLDDGHTFAELMDAYGSTSNLMYFKLYDHYHILITALPSEYIDRATALMEEIEALTNA